MKMGRNRQGKFSSFKQLTDEKISLKQEIAYHEILMQESVGELGNSLKCSVNNAVRPIFDNAIGRFVVFLIEKRRQRLGK
jgi:hypothetical protein